MLVDIFTTKERAPYIAFLKLKERLDNHNFALISLPYFYDPQASFSLLKKIFKAVPFVAFYSPYVGVDKIVSDRMVVYLFKTEWDSKISIEVYDNVLQLTEDIEKRNREDFFHLLFISLTNIDFVKTFPILAGKRRKTKICGFVSGSYNGKQKLINTPVITNNGIFTDKIVTVIFEKFQAECYALIGFKPLGPPFEFKSKNFSVMTFVEDKTADNFFKEILKKADLKEDETNLMFFPLVLGLRKRNVWHIRHPRRLVKGGVEFWGPLPEEGRFRFGMYIDVAKQVEKKVSYYRSKLNSFDFVFAFNCVGKQPFVSPSYEFERFESNIQIPFLFLGSFGEIYTDKNGLIHYLNGSLTTVFLKEKQL